MSEKIKLNLGSGNNKQEGFINVDKFGEPDVLFDLETFPWPWETSSVSIVRLVHVLEHLGRETEIYFGIIQELYRICEDKATIFIAVPHPRHDHFIGDPTHVRPITPHNMSLFSKRLNRRWQKDRSSNTPLAMYLDVDLEIDRTVYIPDKRWKKKLDAGEITSDEYFEAVKTNNNVCKEIRIYMSVHK